jgi:hypothetical protein
MYSLLFHNKWLAALWAGSILLGIFLSTPREGESPSVSALIGDPSYGSSREMAMARAKEQEERARRAKLDAFNAGEDEPQVQLVESYTQ